MSKVKWYDWTIYLLLALILSLGILAAPAARTVEANWPITILTEDFEGGLPGAWSVVTNEGCPWRDDDPGDRGAVYGCSGTFMIADSDYCGKVDMDTELITTSIDCSDYIEVILEFDHYFEIYWADPNEKGDVDVWDGSGWTNVARYQDETGYSVGGHVMLDISDIAAGNSDVKVRWHYYDANCEWYWEVDNVELCGRYKPPPVGGEAYPINKISLLAPWIAVGVIVAGGAIWYVLRRRRAQS